VEKILCSGCRSDSATMQCPTCKVLGLKVFFCSQECFKSNWKKHKTCHEITKCDFLKYMGGIGLSGVRIELRPYLGRVLVASGSFRAGDVVLEEQPFCTFENGIIGLLEQYSKMSEEKKELLMDFQHISSLEEFMHKDFRDQVESRSRDCQRLFEKFDIDVATGIKLHTLMLLNTHMFDCGDGVPRGALFCTASKMSHDCDPNCSYSSRARKGHLVYFATKDIKEGDLISFSYIEKEHLPASQRRDHLQRTKNFYCKCQKCLDEDLSYGFLCANSSCTGASCPSPSSSGGADLWNCTVCGDSSIPSGSKFAAEEIYDKFLTLQEITVDITPDHSKLLIEMITKISALTSRTNFMLVEMEEYLAKVLAVEAQCWEDVGSVNKASISHRLAAQALLSATKRIECSSQRCKERRKQCSIDHPPHYFCSNYVLLASKHLSKCKGTLPPKLSTYTNFLGLCFGYDDPDVLLFQKI
jgi:hypothetical protein